VGQPRTLVHGGHAGQPGGPGPGVGHHGGAALMPGRDEPGPAGYQRVGDVKVAAPDHAEHGVHPEPGQPAADRLRDPHAQERSTSASARHGDPEPPTMGSGPAITTAPVTGSRARFRSCVRPYLPAPSSIEWQGNGGAEGGAPPGPGPRGSGTTPRTRR